MLSLSWGCFSGEYCGKRADLWPRKLHNEELDNLHHSTNMRVIKSELRRWAGLLSEQTRV
jgi:hypothetical protein